MLKHDQAQAELKQLLIEDWTEKRLKEIGKLPANLTRVGRFILGYDPITGKPFDNWEKRNEWQQRTPGDLAALKPAERTRLFSTLFPQLGKQLEATWQLHRRLPYSIGYARKGFRSPSDEALVLSARWQFVTRFVNSLSGYSPTVQWLAAWAPYVAGGGVADSIGLVLAAAIDANDETSEEVFQTLLGSINRTHAIGAMGRHVTRALLVAGKPEGWEAIEKLLLAAQRQEGLRQSILETVDEAHPEAFKRMLKVVQEHNLLRFSAAIRAAMVWFNLAERENDTVTRYNKAVAMVLKYFEDDAACQAALDGEEDDALHLALWVRGYEDVTNAIPLATALLKDRKVERRDLAVRFLNMIQTPEARQVLRPGLADADLRVAVRAFYAIQGGGAEEHTGELFEPLKALLARLPEKPTTLKPVGSEPTGLSIQPSTVADALVQNVGTRGLDELLPFIPRMGDWQRGQMAEKLVETKPLTPALREVIFGLLGDRVPWVRRKVMDAIKKLSLEPHEAVIVESTLARKAGDVREPALVLLAKQKAEAALTSADRLLDSKNAHQKSAGLELLRHLVSNKKSVAACRERATAWQAKQRKITEQDQLYLDEILNIHRERPTLDNGLGLFDPARLTPATKPKKRSVQFMTPAGPAIITALDEFIQANGEEMIVLDGRPSHSEEEGVNLRQLPLAAITYQLPTPQLHRDREEDLARMPLREKFTQWWQNRPAELRDEDGLELIRAQASLDCYHLITGDKDESAALKKARKTLSGGLAIRPEYKTSGSVLPEMLSWLVRLDQPDAGDFLLDAAETGLALVPEEILNQEVKANTWRADWRDWNVFEFWFDRVSLPRLRTPEQRARYFHLQHWLQKPSEIAPLRRMDWNEATLGYELGLLNLDDLAELLFGPRAETRSYYYYNRSFQALAQVTGRQPGEFLTQHPEVLDLVERVRQRVLEVELGRGDLPTAASEPASSLSSVEGLDLLERLMVGLGTRGLQRKLHGTGRGQVFSQLIQRCYPRPEDTPEAFTARMKALVKAKTISPELPLQLAFFNTRWVEHVAHYQALPGLPEAVWWFHAASECTPDLPEPLAASIIAARMAAQPNTLQAINPWTVMVAERTTLSDEDRNEGAVDTVWFHRAVEAVTPKRWKAVQEASKFLGSGGEHKKAERLADVLLGKAKRSDLLKEVRDRKLKGSVRLLGLLPLARGDRRETDLHQRWKAINEYRKYARSLSPMSREDAIRTGEIGLANLARTAGYSDPNRLVWAMEWNEIQDLAAGPVVVTAEGVSVTLALDEQAQPVTTIRRGEKELKAIPPKVRKDKKVAALVERRTALRQQASRIRISLEAMMIRGDTILGEELPQLMKHPLVAKNLSRLVLTGEGVRGYPLADGKALENSAGKKEPVKKDGVLRLAHPIDFLEANDWHDWQAHCFRIERVQPFKQIFRELYLVTDAERSERTYSRRYSGQQVNQNQAMALFGTRGWRTKDGVERTFSEQDIVAEVTFQYGVGTPLEVEGLTLDRLWFHRRGSYAAIPLTEIPRRLFSEVMRDLDLVVSVAHVGGVDPEASASTIEMRAALAMELCSLLSLKNVKHKAPHLLIDGTLGKYSLHLGSGTVHKMPGGAVCIVSVPAQHRGRIFLPFADDDPRTAEVIAKLLMLARDEEIQDPGILDQLRR